MPLNTFAAQRGYDIDNVPATAFDRMGFEQIEFPYKDLQVKGGLRYALHEFPHSPGAEVEKQGRKAYVVTCTGLFHYIPGSELDRQYPELYPTKLRQLRTLFEKEWTGELVVPTIGKIKAVATSWTQSFNTHVPTGEDVTLEFTEDQDATKSFEDQTSDYGLNQVLESNDALLAAAALADFNSKNAVSIFQQISDAVTSVQAISGQADAYSRLVEGKIQAIVNLCSYADGQLEDMQNPQNHVVLDALKDLWLAAQKLAANVIETRQALLSYRVPRLMSVNQVTAAIYGDTSKTTQILQLNAFEDALAIPAGTLVIYAAS